MRLAAFEGKKASAGLDTRWSAVGTSDASDRASTATRNCIARGRLADEKMAAEGIWPRAALNNEKEYLVKME